MLCVLSFVSEFHWILHTVSNLIELATGQLLISQFTKPKRKLGCMYTVIQDLICNMYAEMKRMVIVASPQLSAPSLSVEIWRMFRYTFASTAIDPLLHGLFCWFFVDASHLISLYFHFPWAMKLSACRHIHYVVKELDHSLLARGEQLFLNTKVFKNDLVSGIFPAHSLL